MRTTRVPQFEFGFDSEPMALVGQEERTPTRPEIVAEMTPEERERFQEEAARVDFEALAKLQTSPGLAPGSFWTVEGKGTPSDPTMLKALATMQGGR